MNEQATRDDDTLVEPVPPGWVDRDSPGVSETTAADAEAGSRRELRPRSERTGMRPELQAIFDDRWDDIVDTLRWLEDK